MKKILRKIVICMLTFVFGVATWSMGAFAAGGLTVALPVAVELTGEDIPASSSYTVVLQADLDSDPMPQGSTGNMYTMEVSGAGTFLFPEISYTTPGEYNYTVWQENGSDSRCTYDTAVYDVKVYITNAEDGSGLASTVIAYKNTEAQKLDEIRFTNTYDPEVQPIAITVNKVWSGTSQERPDSVTVQLMNGDEAVATVSLGDWNNWTYTWTDLDGHGSWDVKEINIPNGYSASYSRSGNVITIKNTEILIQTGQIKWPVPVLAGAGLLLILSGVTGLKKKRTTGDA